ncbi:MAG: type II 3-dehydroquinate dehydratase [Chitinophagaceae bacterium]|nr:type II 3-dehydroquinate dehydratase [Chitinophagaceae bacterium]MCW5913221.1 type II 3-dehydroquinate dehydratase [Chitinophagaceae bacterium]MCZ2397012.1 type II 3-dehydroquinate dehydratase [Chitinophagales bacterium]
MRIAIINGPNLNLVGTREPGVYGNETFEEYLVKLRKKFTSVEFTYYQSNVEGELVNEIQHAARKADGIILNAGAYTHTSIAIADAVAAIQVPVIEVHISNIAAREDFRKHSYLSAKCAGTIFGFGMKGYELAVSSLVDG